MLHGQDPLGQLLGALAGEHRHLGPAQCGGPASSAGVTSCTVTPVSLSPAASTARWTASPTMPRPPWRGSRLGWMLMVRPRKAPKNGRSQQLVIARQQGKFRAGLGQCRADGRVARIRARRSRRGAAPWLGTPWRPPPPRAGTPGRLLMTRTGSHVGQPPVGNGVEHRFQVRATAGDEDPQPDGASPHASDEGDARRVRRRPAPRSRPAPPRAPPRTATSTCSGWTTAVMPIPRLKVRTISSSAMSPRSWIRLKMRGTRQDAGLDLDAQASRQRARDVVDPAAAGDVRKGQHVDPASRSARRRRRISSR